MTGDHNTQEQKAEIRREARRCRARITADPEYAARAARIFMEEISPQKGDVVSVYWPFGTELGTLDLMESLFARGCLVALPRMCSDTRVLSFHAWREGDPLLSSTKGKGKGGIGKDIMEPAADLPAVRPDIVLTPLLAFDRKGTRLGYGGGYYDATLAAYRKDGHPCRAVGFAYAEQLVLFPLPRAEHDVPLDAVVTPDRMIMF